MYSPEVSPGKDGFSSAKAWARALELTARIGQNRDRVLPTVIQEVAARCGDAVALVSDGECLTYRTLTERSNRYARWALAHGIKKGEVVCLLMTNRPEYIATWIGLTGVGVVLALLNTNLVASSLAHCIDLASPKHIIVDAQLTSVLTAAMPHMASTPEIWVHGNSESSFHRIDLNIELHSDEILSNRERRRLTIEDRAFYIYTSGTTGLPKAANVSHARVMQWSHWFAGMMAVGPTDRMYSCLPMYHGVGGVLVPGAALVGGGSLAIRERFSARQFWVDVVRWNCTIFQYIGELCRYLLDSPASPNDIDHSVRIACGNGLAPQVWDGFQSRFRIPRIFEFYAATEGGVALFNIQGRSGSIGHIPRYLAHRFSPALVRFDIENGAPVRNDQGFCVPCAPNEIGEAIGRVVNDPGDVANRFEGYTSEKDSEERILRGVFEPGDIWVRTGDLMRKDAAGYFYFVDRIGDTFRWKGENVSTSEVAEVICNYPGIQHASVYGVRVSNNEGRAGMAAVVTALELDLSEFREHLMTRLPDYARPLFLRVRKEVELTGTFKYSKVGLMREGFDPAATTDIIYFDSPETGQFVQLDNVLYDRLQFGGIRV